MNLQNIRVVSLWSGGKDSCLALYRAKRDGYQVISLVNFTSKDTDISRSHGLHTDLLSHQASLMDIPIIQSGVERGEYAETFRDVINRLKESSGVEGIVFGDIYLDTHREWTDAICQELGMKQIMPLWKNETRGLLLEFIGAGFEAIIVSTRCGVMEREWLGCKINEEFMERLSQMPKKIDPCGEEGEFHTLVTDGPLFKRPLLTLKTRNVLRDGRWFLEILEWE